MTKPSHLDLKNDEKHLILSFESILNILKKIVFLMKNDLLDAYNSTKHIRKPHQYQKNDFFHVYLQKYETYLTLHQYFYMYTYNSYIGLT